MPDNDAPLTARDLRAYLETHDDFAFEREIFTHAKGFGLTVQHAGLYEDPATSKLRQYDLRASMEQGDRRIRLAIECKSLEPGFPLLVSCVPRAEDESYHQLMYGITGSTLIGGGNAAVRDMRTALYLRNDPVGKDMGQVARKGTGFVRTDEKALFDKYQQAMASASNLVVEAAEFHRPRRTQEPLTAILPVLVVPDATLWQARYSSNGRLEGDPEPTHEVSFYLGRRYSVPGGRDFTISHLHVMTKTRMTGFLQEVGNAGVIWHLLFDAS